MTDAGQKVKKITVCVTGEYDEATKEIKGGDDVKITVGEKEVKDVNAALEELKPDADKPAGTDSADADKPAGAAGAGNEGDAAGADPVSADPVSTAGATADGVEGATDDNEASDQSIGSELKEMGASEGNQDAAQINRDAAKHALKKVGGGRTRAKRRRPKRTGTKKKKRTKRQKKNGRKTKKH